MSELMSVPGALKVPGTDTRFLTSLFRLHGAIGRVDGDKFTAVGDAQSFGVMPLPR